MREKLIEFVHDARMNALWHNAPNQSEYMTDMLIDNGVTIPVRCKECKCFKPAHFKADDGTEEPWDETFSFDGRTDGIYIGGKCKHIRNTAYGEKDMAFRKPDDFCSYGERRTDETKTD